LAIKSLPWNAKLRESRRHAKEEFILETLGVKVEPGVEHIQNGSELLAIILSYRYRESKMEIPV